MGTKTWLRRQNWNLTMNRWCNIVCLFLGILSILPATAQLRFVAWSNEYVEVSSYLGKETPERFNTFQFQLNGNNIDVKNWSLSVRLLAPIEVVEGGPNRSGKSFPADKISLKWRVDDNHAQTNLRNIGVSLNDIFLQNANEVLLINRSKTPIHSYGSYYSVFTLFGSLKISAGKYLDDYISMDQYTSVKYRMPLLYTLYDEQGKILGTQQIFYVLHILPRLTDGNLVDVEPDYSLTIGTEATNATLSFVSDQDYTQGVSQVLTNAIKVHSMTDFELRIKSLEPEFIHNEGGAMPLSILSLHLTPGQGARPIVSNPVVVLSTDEQVALSGTSENKKNAQYFNLGYKASLTKQQVLSSKPGTYTVSLLYLLIPR